MPAMTRLGDKDIPHCGPMVRKGHSITVFANGIPLSCQGHLNTPHLYPVPPFCKTHAMPIIKGSPNVFSEGRPVGRVGDKVGPNCTAVAQGSPNVFANGGAASGFLKSGAAGGASLV